MGFVTTRESFWEFLPSTAESLQGGLRAIGGESEVVIAGLAGALDYIFTVIIETGIAGLLLSAAHRMQL
jgi:hypothetical protein